ncbi:MAG: hypothetical protein ACM3SQ_06745 [Betaproteobacteria bacterium]
MPPRYAFWTILIDDGSTAFRARERAELLPTLAQLRRTNKNVEMRWFARGRLWTSPEEERAARQRPKPAQKRGRDWRPGGEHKDPRAHFRELEQKRRQEKRKRSFERKQRDGRGPKPHHPRSERKPFPAPKERPPRRDERPESPPKPGPVVIKPKPPERG